MDVGNAESVLDVKVLISDDERMLTWTEFGE